MIPVPVVIVGFYRRVFIVIGADDKASGAAERTGLSPRERTAAAATDSALELVLGDLAALVDCVEIRLGVLFGDF